MPRPLKYLEGDPITTIGEFTDQIESGRYMINRYTRQRIHPGWAKSWQFNMCLNAVKKQVLLRAIPNPEHPENKEKS